MKRVSSKKVPFISLFIVAAVGAAAYFGFNLVNKKMDKPISSLWFALGAIAVGALAFFNKKTRTIAGPLLVGGAFMGGIEAVKNMGSGNLLGGRYRNGMRRPMESLGRPMESLGRPMENMNAPASYMTSAAEPARAW